MPEADDPMALRMDAMRRFNRFYTRRIGVLHEGLLHTTFTLTESRLLWELAHHDGLTATDLARELNLDPGYLSRLLGSFKQRGLVKPIRSKADARHLHLRLTAAGRRAFAPLDTRSRSEVGAVLERLTEPQQQQLLRAMATIENLLDDRPQRPAAFVLRPHRAGDLGWIVSRHGALYAHEYKLSAAFEALVARIVTDFVERFDAAAEACWIAERGGENVGSVMLVHKRDPATQAPIDGVAQLRLLLVEPLVRGQGLGEQLVAECERFARHAGYLRIVLWTNGMLSAARHIYQKAGYRLVHSEPHHSFGHDLVGETWELALQ